MRLSELSQGQKARIKEVADSNFKEKLNEMGCIVGEEISIMFKAPFGDPVAYLVAGYCLSMRLKEASTVEVELIHE